MSDGWPFYEDFCVFGAFHHLGWLLCWGEPVAPLLGWTNGSFVGVNQWLPCSGEPMVSRARPLRGRAPFGARWAGPPLPCVERKYWKSSQEKVSRKTTLYFFGKTLKTVWNLSRTTDLVERIRMQFFSSKIDWKSLELWHFFSILHFIYFLPIFQFLVYALPIRFWQVLMKSKNPKV